MGKDKQHERKVPTIPDIAKALKALLIRVLGIKSPSLSLLEGDSPIITPEQIKDYRDPSTVQKRRWASIEIPSEIVLELVRRLSPDIPDDAQIVASWNDTHLYATMLRHRPDDEERAESRVPIVLKVKSAEFEPLADGDAPPTIRPYLSSVTRRQECQR